MRKKSAQQKNARLERSFGKLLSGRYKEEVFQKFLENNPKLIPREFLRNHGIHLDLALSKLSLAKDYTTDFFYMSKSSACWNLILVEIEKPHSRYFKSTTNEFHRNFVDALSQVSRWKAWFDRPGNRAGFIDDTIGAIRVPKWLDNPCHIKYVLVHGRRDEIGNNAIRRGLIRAQENDDFHILTYDSLLEGLAGKHDLYIGVRKNEYFDILSPTLVSESIFSWVDPTYLRITESLRANILARRAEWFHRRIGKGLVLDDVLPRVGKCRDRRGKEKKYKRNSQKKP